MTSTPTKVLVLHHSSYGHVAILAKAAAEGAAWLEGVEASLKRVPETMDESALRAAGMKGAQKAPLADPQELDAYNAIILGTPTGLGT